MAPDSPSPDRHRRVMRTRVVWLIGFLAFTLNGLFNFSYRYLEDLANGRRNKFVPRMVDEMSASYAVGLLFPLVVLLARRFPVRRGSLRLAVPVHFAAMAGFATLHTTMMWASRSVLYPLLGLGTYDFGIMYFRYPMEAARQFVSYWGFAALVWTFDYYRRARDRQLAAAELEGRLARAQIENLRLQLQPHFLFNALNTISSVMYEDVRKADTMIAQLSDLLRRTLKPAGSQYVPLSEELSLLKVYLDIMQARFGDTLSVEFAVEPGANEALVPQLILQPLVENSIRHGADAPSSRLEVHVGARRENGTLLLEVKDRGPGISGLGDNRVPKGIGLTNTAERLAGLYGREHEFLLENRAGGGLNVTVRIPYRSS